MPYRIDKDNADYLLKELATEFRKEYGRKTDVELVIVGGGSILLNYHFRTMTEDFDISSNVNRQLKEVSIKIRDKYDLEYNWINSDFLMTGSNSNLLRQYSSLYKRYNNGHFIIRTIKAEYLIAMKAVSFREYKSDKSDIIGILKEEKENGNNISFDRIQKAIERLYGKNKSIDIHMSNNLKEWCNLSVERLEKLYDDITYEEENIALELKDLSKETEHGISFANLEDAVKMIKEELQISEDNSNDFAHGAFEKEEISDDNWNDPIE